MEKPKRLEDQKYFLENIIEAITFWFNTNRGGGTPTAIGAIVQRYAGNYLKTVNEFGYSGDMDNLRKEANKQLEQVKIEIGMKKMEAQVKRELNATLFTPIAPGYTAVHTEKEWTIKTRREQLEAMTLDKLDEIYFAAQKVDLKKQRIKYILEAEKKY